MPLSSSRSAMRHTVCARPRAQVGVPSPCGSYTPAQALARINAFGNTATPVAIVDVPRNRLAQTGVDHLARTPIELFVDLAGIERVAAVVAATVVDEANQVAIAGATISRMQLIEIG